MRGGRLAKMSDMPNNVPAVQSQGSYGEPMATNRNPGPTEISLPTPQSHLGSLTWQGHGDDQMSTMSSHLHGNQGSEFKSHKDVNEVEIMSSDSSSSSSSDE
ncbi:uncharacterized protein LOC127852864 isoform X1 [Dreissena polymorpha]|uniref:uncharacterized protein LOC127852864 isoform X1 n=1 Tax=Dreissena polymorpha TaxID=45954 RepID=UPI002263D9D0|nr:uncharacterized protein LOC127852864 isoform X1 [Dreissena polymorpha]XP_052242836.1 uncharacterized protein LOC127852864 isoform X1 [Dreissena polymorpha]XP_052242837.1 uncharacterized protein LOC127852864 isoform X1 [Dreissena polymorpha]XP_052242838.1 uncharacterized protein LOC127852864 isoform X1 [Dreissena polymorpha]